MKSPNNLKNIFRWKILKSLNGQTYHIHGLKNVNMSNLSKRIHEFKTNPMKISGQLFLTDYLRWYHDFQKVYAIYENGKAKGFENSSFHKKDKQFRVLAHVLEETQTTQWHLWCLHGSAPILFSLALGQLCPQSPPQWKQPGSHSGGIRDGKPWRLVSRELPMWPVHWVPMRLHLDSCLWSDTELSLCRKGRP